MDTNLMLQTHQHPIGYNRRCYRSTSTFSSRWILALLGRSNSRIRGEPWSYQGHQGFLSERIIAI